MNTHEHMLLRLIRGHRRSLGHLVALACSGRWGLRPEQARAAVAGLEARGRAKVTDALFIVEVPCEHRWRGRSQFCHDSYETHVWHECAKCGEERPW